MIGVKKKKLNHLVKKKINSISFNLFDAVVISDYDKGLLNTHTVNQILMRAKNKKVFVDSKKTDLSCYNNCIIKINQNEYASLTDLPPNYDLIITLGEDGALYLGERFPTNKAEIFDVCGAGDTFLSALVYAYLATADMNHSIRFANHCSSIVVQKFGTYAIQREDLDGLCF